MSFLTLSKGDVPETKPEFDEVETTLFGPGYGECIALHLGTGHWALVDSCIESSGCPVALTYLGRLGVDPSAVKLVVATHWHDDHIRGMGRLVEECSEATFCCSAALNKREFLAAVGAIQNRQMTVAGSGVRELHCVLNLLKDRGVSPRFAIGNRLVLAGGNYRVVALSPDDSMFEAFLARIGELIPGVGERKGRAGAPSPNAIAVALWVRAFDSVVLLGSDLERRGWQLVLRNRDDAITTPASVFKIPHHGSANAHLAPVWDEFLGRDPLALLTPWSRAGRVLPTDTDVKRIASQTPKAYVTRDRPGRGPIRRRPAAVERSLREAGTRVTRVATSTGAVRLRKKIGASDWRVDLLGAARALDSF